MSKYQLNITKMEPEPEIVNFDIISKFPAEIQCMILETLNRAERTLCIVVCVGWKRIIESFWPGIKSSSNFLLSHASKHGYEELLRFAKLWGAKRFDIGMKCAAEAGHLELMVILKDWSLIKPQDSIPSSRLVIDTALMSAALGGHPKGMKLAKSWGALRYKIAMQLAASGGSPECMKLAKLWIETSSPTLRNRNSTNLDDRKKRYIERALKSAIKDSFKFSSLNGEIVCMKLAKEWGADEYNRAMMWASFKCQFEAMKLLREWGASQFDKSIEKLMREIVSYKNRINKNGLIRWYGEHRAGSYVEFKVGKGYKKQILIKVPTVSQKERLRVYYQTELKKMLECLELLKTWKEKEESTERPTGT